MACGWLTNRCGLCWQIVPRHSGGLIRQPKAIEAKMRTIKMDRPALAAGTRGKGEPWASSTYLIGMIILLNPLFFGAVARNRNRAMCGSYRSRAT